MRFNYAETTRRSDALHLSLSGDFSRIATAFLTGGKSTIPPFNGLEVLTTSTDKANLFARNFSCNFTIDDGSQQLPDFPVLNGDFKTKNITTKKVSRAIYDLETSKATCSRQNSSNCP